MVTKKTKSQLGKMSRTKGKVFERKVANTLKERGFEARRGVQFKGGINSHDVDCETLDYYNFECKHVESLNLQKAMTQSADDCVGSKARPIVVHKKNKCKTLVTMRLEDWIDLIQWAHNYQDKYNNLEIDRDRFNRTLKTEEIAEESLL